MLNQKQLQSVLGKRVRMYQIIFYLFFFVLSITALEDFNKFSEGSCSKIPAKPVVASRDFVDSLRYITGVSKFQFHKAATPMPNYEELTEDELYYDFCYTRNTTSASSYGGAFGFGRLLVPHRVVVEEGSYLIAVPSDPSSSWDPNEQFVQTVILTDHKTFALVHGCWTGSDEVIWIVYSSRPRLDAGAREAIEKHLSDVGFKRENFIFPRYDSCKFGYVILDKRTGQNVYVPPKKSL